MTDKKFLAFWEKPMMVRWLKLGFWTGEECYC